MRRVIPINGNGTAALKAVAGHLATQFPDLKYDIKPVIAEGDLVRVRSNVILTPGSRGTAVVDIFRAEPQDAINGRAAEPIVRDADQLRRLRSHAAKCSLSVPVRAVLV
ncbi:nuclear transport factor 2 family protein [Lentzea alba]|uniref:nuclear transport factor 2 family protein n=1 Tax=Lentzea alba TaxID=2714351 RepID=UPI0039BFC4F3